MQLFTDGNTFFDVRIYSERLAIRAIGLADIDEWFNFIKSNAERFFPRLSKDEIERAVSLERMLGELRELEPQVVQNKKVRFGLFLKEESRLLGEVEFSNFVGGIFQACHLGYRIDGKYEGKGYMFEAIQACVNFLFDRGLHRVMANYMPSNERSAKLLKRMGFTVEGYAYDYLFIDGQWRDHILTSLINAKPSDMRL